MKRGTQRGDGEKNSADVCEMTNQAGVRCLRGREALTAVLSSWALAATPFSTGGSLVTVSLVDSIHAWFACDAAAYFSSSSNVVSQLCSLAK